MTKCERCKGEGFIWVCLGLRKKPAKHVCPGCEGKGYIEESEAEEEANAEYREYINMRLDEARSLQQNQAVNNA